MPAPQHGQEDCTRRSRFRDVLDSEFSGLKERLLHEFEQQHGLSSISICSTSLDLTSDVFEERALKNPKSIGRLSNAIGITTPRTPLQDASAAKTEFLQTAGIVQKRGSRPDAIAQTSSPREDYLITPREGPRIEMGHLETFVSADIGGSDVDEGHEVVRKVDSRKTEIAKSTTPLERWRQLGLALMSPRARHCLARTTYYMHDCWAHYWNMLRHNDRNCKKDLTSAMAKVLRGRQGLLGGCMQQSTVSLLLKSPQSFLKRFVVHPDSKQRLVWVILSFIVLSYDTATLPLLVFFEFDDIGILSILTWAAAIFWSLDIMVSFISGRYIKGILELRPFVIARSYVKSWFPFDAALAMLDLSTALLDTMSHADDSSSTVVIGALRGARIVRLLRLLRLIKTRNIFGEAFPINGKGMIVVSGMLKILLVFGIYCHIWACVWYGIGRIDSNGWGTMCKNEARELIHCYFRGAQWVLTQPLGTSLITYSTSFEWIFSTLSLPVGLMFIATLLAKTADTVTHFTAAAKLEMRQCCVAYARRHTLPTELSHRFIRYIDASDLQVDLGQQLRREREILHILPLSMQAEILEESRKPYLKQVCVIGDLTYVSPNSLKALCAEATRSRMCLNGEAVFTTGDGGTHWRLCEFGNLVYISGLDHWIDLFMATTATPAIKERIEAKRERMETGWSLVRSQKACWSCQGRLDGEAAFCPTCGAQQVTPTCTPRTTRRVRTSCTSPSLHSISNDSWESKTGNGDDGGCSAITQGRSISEMVLWTSWVHTGDLLATSDSVMLELSFENFANAMKFRVDTCLLAARYAQQFVKEMSSIAGGISDLHEFTFSETEEDSGALGHLIFLSHYKAEAGTEATLMMEGIQMLLEREVGATEEGAVFLDSEDLTDLTTLKDHVSSSSNVVFLLTPGVLLRPWCLVEIVTAMDNGVQIVPVEIQRPGLDFSYPGDEFYARLRKGDGIDLHDKNILLSEGITMDIVINTLQFVFQQIALPFSPHKSKGIREAELIDIMQRCRLLKTPGLARQKTNTNNFVAAGSDEAPLPRKTHKTRNDRKNSHTSHRTSSTSSAASALSSRTASAHLYESP